MSTAEKPAQRRATNAECGLYCVLKAIDEAEGSTEAFILEKFLEIVQGKRVYLGRGRSLLRTFDELEQHELILRSDSSRGEPLKAEKAYVLTDQGRQTMVDLEPHVIAKLKKRSAASLNPRNAESSPLER